MVILGIKVYMKNKYKPNIIKYVFQNVAKNFLPQCQSISLKIYWYLKIGPMV